MRLSLFLSNNSQTNCFGMLENKFWKSNKTCFALFVNLIDFRFCNRFKAFFYYQIWLWIFNLNSQVCLMGYKYVWYFMSWSKKQLDEWNKHLCVIWAMEVVSSLKVFSSIKDLIYFLRRISVQNYVTICVYKT